MASGSARSPTDVGVTAMLVNRYFGSKEQLFAEVVAAIMTKPILLTGAVAIHRGGPRWPTRSSSLTAAGGAPLDGFRSCFGTAVPAAGIAREQIEAQYHTT